MNQQSNEPSHSESPEFTRQVNKAVAYACRLLGVREYSHKMISGKLLDKGFEREVAIHALEVLAENGWLSDERFCSAFIRSRVAKGQGLKRIQFELGQKGIGSTLRDSVLEALEIDWQDACDLAAEKKVALIKDITELKSRLKIERFLQYRGFSSTEIRNAMNKQIKHKGETTGEHVE